MKRILYLTFYFRPDLCAGSFRNSPLVDELARQIENENIEVDVITSSPNRYATFRKNFKQTEQLGNISIERIVVPSHESGVKDQIFSFKTYFFEVLNRTRYRQYDLVFASSSRFFTSFLGYLIAKRNQIPLYLDIRDLFSETIESISSNSLIKYLVTPVLKRQENKVYEYATHINLISEGFLEDFTKFNSTHFSFFTHGVDPIFKKAQNKRTIKKEETKKIVYAGNIGEGQGLHKIIPKAAKLLNGKYSFRIIGDGGAKQKLEDELQKLNVTNVQIKDPVNRNKVIEEYNEADILFIHLNNQNIFRKVLPSKIFEQAVIEKPIVAGVQGYARTFLKKNVNGVFLFNPGDVDEFFFQIEKIEKHLETKVAIDNKRFSKIYNRKKINREMIISILSYL
jgi:glycosyltransferase involved in cell wall biosynthesis